MEKELNLLCVFCNNWFLPKKIQALEKSLIKDLKDKGYNAKISVEASDSPSKPYYLYLQNGNSKKIIFSNNANLHRKEGAIIDYCVTDANRKKVVQKIIDIVKK